MPAPPKTGVEPFQYATSRRSGPQPRETGVQPHETGLQPRETGVQPRQTGVQPRKNGVKAIYKKLNINIFNQKN